ncbi:glycoside hydrolase superfamily [Dactylonectria estremocensis]|uniref:Probable glucan endo-1,3-beta-glucosidase eglC n=1 Tax=Dactylonectria estremocensis TaxID=1079267 RepID=A0A9P9FEP3_9HYPO|nr:glycoside hydrolase superfamily [Dactylonectria estremocensis]
MPSTNSLLAMAAAVSTASAAFQGFNYGATYTDGTVKVQSNFEDEFNVAASLVGTDGAFTSARIYTMIQGGSINDPISAIPAAIKTKTTLLLGLWASAGRTSFDNEIAALKNTIDQYCGQIDDLVAGISVGSEDLYRISETGIAADSDPGCSPDTLVEYIAETRAAIEGTCLSAIPVGHVDTWNAYSNSSNSAVIEACDWLGMDTYPYFEDTKYNPVSEGANLFQTAYDKVVAVAGSREIWITETGWPVSGKTYNKAIPSTKNARTYWEDVGCPLFGSTNVWWYTLQDSAPTTPNPSFGVIGSSLTKTPLYDLSCDGVDKTKVSAGSGASDSKSGNSGSDSTATPATAATPASTPTGAQCNGSCGGIYSNSTVTGIHSAYTTLAAASTPISSSSSGSGSGSDSGSGSSASTAASASSTTATGSSTGAQLNSFGAAAVALVLAVAVL